MATLVKNHIAPFINAALNAEPISGYWFGFSNPVFASVKVLHVRMILGLWLFGHKQADVLNMLSQFGGLPRKKV